MTVVEIWPGASKIDEEAETGAEPPDVSFYFLRGRSAQLADK